MKGYELHVPLYSPSETINDSFDTHGISSQSLMNVHIDGQSIRSPVQSPIQSSIRSPPEQLIQQPVRVAKQHCEHDGYVIRDQSIQPNQVSSQNTKDVNVLEYRKYVSINQESDDQERHEFYRSFKEKLDTNGTIERLKRLWEEISERELQIIMDVDLGFMTKRQKVEFTKRYCSEIRQL